MRPSEYPGPKGSESAAMLIDEAISIIEKTGWWNGKSPRDRRNAEGLPQCAVTAINRASVMLFGYEDALTALVAEIPEAFKLTYGSFDRFTWITMYNDYTNKETVLAWMRRAAERLRRESNDSSTSPVVGRGELAEAGAGTDSRDVQPSVDSGRAGTSA